MFLMRHNAPFFHFDKLLRQTNFLKIISLIIFIYAAILLNANAYGQGTLSSDELLLNPTNLPTFERQTNLIWKPIRDKISTIKDRNLTGRPQVALVNIYVRNNTLQLAFEYTKNILVPVWRAQALLIIADNQLEVGNDALANRMLQSALLHLNNIGDFNQEPEIFGNAALAIVKTGDYNLLRDFFENINHEDNIIAMARATYPKLEPQYQDIVLDALERVSTKFRSQNTPESFDFYLARARLSQTLKIDRLYRESLRIAYNIALLQKDSDNKKSNEQLEQLANNLLAVGQQRLASQVIIKISDRTIQTKLYATAGRVQSQIRENPEAGNPLLNLASDSVFLIGEQNFLNRKRFNKKETEANKNYAKSWVLIEKVQAGLVAEALRDTDGIEDNYQRQRAIALIALVLTDLEQYDEVQNLLGRIDFANLRLGLFIGLAQSVDRPNTVTDSLLEALESNNFHESQKGYAPHILGSVLKAQLAFGDQARNDVVFSTIQQKNQTYLTGFRRITAETEYLYYYAKRSELKADYADEQMKILLASLWPYSKEKGFSELIERITEFYLEAGKLEQAFNVAATLMPIHNEAKFRILRNIAEITANDGDEVLTLRVVNQIIDPKIQADVLTDSINNLSKNRTISRF